MISFRLMFPRYREPVLEKIDALKMDGLTLLVVDVRDLGVKGEIGLTGSVENIKVLAPNALYQSRQ